VTSRVRVLPERGTLIAATDLHGNLTDFRALVDRFLAVDDPQLVLCGDLVHGPAIAAADWPDHLGDHYVDESARLIDEAYRLRQRFPDRVTYLLGNHEHAHVGGPMLSKFHPDEARHLEVAHDRFEPVREWMRDWPLAAVAPAAGLALTHAAPHAVITGPADLDAAPLAGYERTPLHEMADSGPVGALLWARTTTEDRAQAFLRALGCRVAAFGHDVVREGHLVEREPLLCFSTSFGCHDGDKVYLEWDLAEPADSAAAVAATGLRRLHPHIAPVYRPVSAS
jgi:hypothetical protein